VVSMGEPIDEGTLADALPGTWAVAATNFPMWLTGTKLRPQFSYNLVTRSPLVLDDDVVYLDEEGAPRQISGVDKWNGHGFTWRGKGVLRLFASHWTVAGLSADRSVAVIRFSKSLATPAGVDVIVRVGTDTSELRATIAHATEDFGLTPEDFASLSWLETDTKG